MPHFDALDNHNLLSPCKKGGTIANIKFPMSDVTLTKNRYHVKLKESWNNKIVS